jgi:N6-adenosine-specific RNA methylase IME4
MIRDGEPRLNNVNRPSIVDDLCFLTALGYRFPTVVADPPWQYANTASRGAAENHYPTLTLQQICSEPIAQIADDNAHLHLWTTNAFLEDAFTIIRAWGFEYKSCMVWVKPTIGMGNYWRVSHEFLLFATRGRLPFGRNDVPSWREARRSRHSSKPFCFRELIEQVSPGPYLEVYGREEHPSTAWTVYGNQVERRLF